MRTVLFSANDPGGAEAILPVVTALHERGDVLLGIASGPARNVFRAKNIPFVDAETMDAQQLVDAAEAVTPDTLLAGTSAGDTVDKQLCAHFAGRIKRIYVLDFWNNYTQRFFLQGIHIIPDLICVMDEGAKHEMVKEGFPESSLIVTGNPHWDHFTEGIHSNNEDKNEVLFISQPISTLRENGFADYGFDEFDALDGVLKTVLSMPELHVSIRLHPKENLHKYDSYCGPRVQVSDAATLADALSAAGLVIGMFSPVLIQAAAAGKLVISYEPDLLGEDPLPTNRFGATHSTTDTKELYTLVTQYVHGSLPEMQVPVSAIFNPGATQRVINVIDTSIRG